MRWYAAWCAAVLLGLAWAESRGVVPFPDAEHAVVPASVRGAPGAFRSYRHVGGSHFRGGK
jgi:hypothetical protein